MKNVKSLLMLLVAMLCLPTAMQARKENMTGLYVDGQGEFDNTAMSSTPITYNGKKYYYYKVVGSTQAYYIPEIKSIYVPNGKMTGRIETTKNYTGTLHIILSGKNEMRTSGCSSIRIYYGNAVIAPVDGEKNASLTINTTDKYKGIFVTRGSLSIRDVALTVNAPKDGISQELSGGKLSITNANVSVNNNIYAAGTLELNNCTANSTFNKSTHRFPTSSVKITPSASSTAVVADSKYKTITLPSCLKIDGKSTLTNVVGGDGTIRFDGDPKYGTNNAAAVHAAYMNNGKNIVCYYAHTGFGAEPDALVMLNNSTYKNKGEIESIEYSGNKGLYLIVSGKNSLRDLRVTGKGPVYIMQAKSVAFGMDMPSVSVSTGSIEFANFTSVSKTQVWMGVTVSGEMAGTEIEFTGATLNNLTLKGPATITNSKGSNIVANQKIAFDNSVLTNVNMKNTKVATFTAGIAIDGSKLPTNTIPVIASTTSDRNGYNGGRAMKIVDGVDFDTNSSTDLVVNIIKGNGRGIDSEKLTAFKSSGGRMFKVLPFVNGKVTLPVAFLGKSSVPFSFMDMQKKVGTVTAYALKLDFGSDVKRGSVYYLPEEGAFLLEGATLSGALLMNSGTKAAHIYLRDYNTVNTTGTAFNTTKANLTLEGAESVATGATLTSTLAINAQSSGIQVASLTVKNLKLNVTAKGSALISSAASATLRMENSCLQATSGTNNSVIRGFMPVYFSGCGVQKSLLNTLSFDATSKVFKNNGQSMYSFTVTNVKNNYYGVSASKAGWTLKQQEADRANRPVVAQ